MGRILFGEFFNRLVMQCALQVDKEDVRRCMHSEHSGEMKTIVVIIMLQ